MPSGSFSLVSTFSHNLMKIYNVLGETGSILCNDKKIYKKLVAIPFFIELMLLYNV